jgi:hypothetical protein
VTQPDRASEQPAATADAPDGPVNPEEEGSAIGWWGAIVIALAFIVVGFLGAVVGSNAILTKSLALTRTAREWLASALFFVTIAILAVALRLLQRSKVI